MLRRRTLPTHIGSNAVRVTTDACLSEIRWETDSVPRASIELATHGCLCHLSRQRELRPPQPTLREIVQGARPARAFLRVDPGLLDHERLPEARGDALDLLVGVRLRGADGHRVREPLRVLLQIERKWHAARHILPDDRDAATPP